MSSSGKRRKTDNNGKKEEAEKRTDEKEETKLDHRNTGNSLSFSFSFPYQSCHCIFTNTFVLPGKEPEMLLNRPFLTTVDL